MREDQRLTLLDTPIAEVDHGQGDLVPQHLSIAVDIGGSTLTQVPHTAQDEDSLGNFRPQHETIQVAVTTALAQHVDTGLAVAEAGVTIYCRVLIIAWPFNLTEARPTVFVGWAHAVIVAGNEG